MNLLTIEQNLLKFPARNPIFSKVAGSSLQICERINSFTGTSLGKYELQKEPPGVFLKILQNSQAPGLQLYLKRDSGTSIFL